MKRHMRRGILAAILMVAAAGGSATVVRGDVLYQQMPGINQVSSQTFPDYPDFSSYAFDDVTVGDSGWTVTKITIAGVDYGDPTQNAAVKLAITTGADFTLVTDDNTYQGVEDDSGNLVFDNLNLTFDPGTTFWITAWVERPSDPGGQWFWFSSNDGSPVGSEFIVQNPGGAFGFGTDPVPGSSVFFGSPADLAFTIEGPVSP